MTRRVGSWAKVALVVVLVAVMAVPTVAMGQPTSEKGGTVAKAAPTIHDSKASLPGHEDGSGEVPRSGVPTRPFGLSREIEESHPSFPSIPTSSPSVAYTLDLCTNKLYSGNALPNDCGVGAVGVAYDSGKGEVFVANQYAYNVSVISDASNREVAKVPEGMWPAGVAYDSGKGEVFVTNSLSNNVSVISDASNKAIAAVPVGSNPLGVAYDSGKGEVFVANGNSNNVSVISDGNDKVVVTIAVGLGPYAVAYDSGKGEVFVANGNSNNVCVINDGSDTVVATVPVGSNPDGVAYDSGKGEFFVTNFIEGTVSIIVPPNLYTVTFTETGLPSGTSWSVTLSGSTLSSTTNTIAFTEPNGTYTYTVGAVAGYTSSPSSGPVTVKGANVTQPITFTKSSTGPAHYTVTFIESGLPRGTSWSVTFNGTMGTSNTSSLVFSNVLNNTTGYPFTVGTVSGYSANPTSGSVVVNGANVTKAITFTAIPPGQYSLSFTETSLPTGTNWSVTVGTTTHSSTGSTVTFTEPNGTYTYTVGAVVGYTVSPSSGSVTVNGASQSIPITFTPSVISTYTVTFTESGLPAGTSWSVNLTGSTHTSTSTTVTFTEPNGTYTYTVGSVTGYTSSPSSGSVMVKGANVSEAITFTAIPSGSYSVTFTESGLPTGTNWSVTLGGKAESSTGSTITFTEKNGTYPYTVTVPSGYLAIPTSGSVNVAGKAVSQGVTFSASPPPNTVGYAVVITESGLPSGALWSVTLNGSTRSSTTTSITFHEGNGSYAFSVGVVTGYTASPSTGTIHVNGAAIGQIVTFTSTSSKGKTNQTTGFLGLSGDEGYLLIGVVVAAVAAAVAVLLLRSRKKSPPGGGVQDSKNIADGAAQQVAVE